MKNFVMPLSIAVCLVVSSLATKAEHKHGGLTANPIIPKSAAQGKPRSKTCKAYQFAQTHFFLGDNKVTVCQKGMLLQNTGRLGFCVVAKAPDWNVTVFRKDDKRYKTQSLKEFEATGLVSDYLYGFHERKLSVTRRVQAVDFHGKTAVRVSGNGERLEYLPVDGICAPQVERILYVIYKCPTYGGVPIHFRIAGQGKDWMTGEDQTNRRKFKLDTTAMNALSVPLTLFDAPIGYGKVASVVEIVSGDKLKGRDSGLEDLLDAGH